MTINVLSDDDLLHIFDYYMAEAQQTEWYTLVYVSQRWRNIVFGSPHRLNLQIFCTSSMLPRKRLDAWPALPIVLSANFYQLYEQDNIKAVLERNERVSQISIPILRHGRNDFDVLAALEKPFPVLTDLSLWSTIPSEPIFPDPDKFLGGSTRLRSLSLSFMPIPEVPKLLPSFTDLVNLRLNRVPAWSRFSPKEIVTGLSALTRLEVFHLSLSEPFLWENQPSSPPTRAVLPSLTVLEFEGGINYLEDFIARIDAPLLDRLAVTLRSIDITGELIFDTDQIVQFISHVPKFQALGEAHIRIDNVESTLSINFLSKQTDTSGPGGSLTVLKVVILCVEPEPESPCLARFCRSPFFPLPMLEDLYIEIIYGDGFDGRIFSKERWLFDGERTRFLQLLRPFTSVKNLHLSKNFAGRIAPVLKELGGEIATAVPTFHQENQFFFKVVAFLSLILDILIDFNLALPLCFKFYFSLAGENVWRDL